MNIPLLINLHKEGLISGSSFEKVKQQPGKQLFSVHWEIRLILYLGILLLTGGLGILVYKNIDSIGHGVILSSIALISATSFYYSFRNKMPFSTRRVATPNAYFDYILLLACLSLLIFLGYLQFQYVIFGDRYGLALFIPMVILFFCAYYFDHIGILSLAITNLAAWVGISVAPLEILGSNDFGSNRIIFSSMLLGICLMLAGVMSIKKKYKTHFAFTYTNFSIHILFNSCLAAMFQFDHLYFLWFCLLLAIACYFYYAAKQRKSFYLLLVSALYGYIGLSYVVIKVLVEIDEEIIFYAGCSYFIGSGIVLILFLMQNNKSLKSA